MFSSYSYYRNTSRIPPFRFGFPRHLVPLHWLRNAQTAPVGGAEQARGVRQDADGALPRVFPDERPRQEWLWQECSDRRENENLLFFKSLV